MANPLFVQTSKGWINLAMVKYVFINEEDSSKLRFIFFDEGEKQVGLDLPLKEGERIMQRLMDTEYVLSG